ncbi:hypothetical protein A0H81_05323 [Grifola frondosa]|uniref:Uncharacterized protein n=1 Tax=Grifola frondosa TaxID=5627 RepID=A0A1C7MDL7_GRIFR|nr:hypothetical protein A0H81_05323 [Grifola frondosa]
MYSTFLVEASGRVYQGGQNGLMHSLECSGTSMEGGLSHIANSTTSTYGDNLSLREPIFRHSAAATSSDQSPSDQSPSNQSISVVK